MQTGAKAAEVTAATTPATLLVVCRSSSRESESEAATADIVVAIAEVAVIVRIGIIISKSSNQRSTELEQQ